MRGSGESYYDTAQICLNGHHVTSTAETYPQQQKKFCPDCGERTIMGCPNCNKPIQGSYFIPGAGAALDECVPAFCHECGHAYPWTAQRIAAARMLADELEVLSTEEREQLKGTLGDLVKETPSTPLAATRFKRLMKKAGTFAADGMKEILKDVLKDAVKTMIWGPSS